jgi:hypothetical protein
MCSIWLLVVVAAADILPQMQVAAAALADIVLPWQVRNRAAATRRKL